MKTFRIATVNARSIHLAAGPQSPSIPPAGPGATRRATVPARHAFVALAVAATAGATPRAKSPAGRASVALAAAARAGVARAGTALVAIALPLFVALAASGCASSSAKFYTMDATATASLPPAGSGAVLVGPVNVPTAVDRPQFVVEVAPNRVEIDEFNLWAAPVDESIARVVAADLGVLLGTHDVAIAPLANFNAAWRVTLDVQQFDSVMGKQVALDAIWTITPTAAGAKPRQGRTTTTEPVAGADYAAIAAAHSRALARLSEDVAKAIREASAPAAAAPTKKKR